MLGTAPVPYLKERAAYERMRNAIQMKGRIPAYYPDLELPASGEYGIVLEGVKGHDLVHSARGLASDDLPVLEDILNETLRRMHTFGVAHGNIRPECILLDRNLRGDSLRYAAPPLSTRAVPVLTDFGSAFVLDGDLRNHETRERWHQSTQADRDAVAHCMELAKAVVYARLAMEWLAAAAHGANNDPLELVDILQFADVNDVHLRHTTKHVVGLNATVTRIMALHSITYCHAEDVEPLMLNFWHTQQEQPMPLHDFIGLSILWARADVQTRALWWAFKRLVMAREQCDDHLALADEQAVEVRRELGLVMVSLLRDFYAIAYNIDAGNEHPVAIAETQGIYVGTPMHENIPLILAHVERMFVELLSHVREVHAPEDPVVVVMSQFRPQLLDLQEDRQRRREFYGEHAFQIGVVQS